MDHTKEISELTLTESVLYFNFDLLKKIINNNLIEIKSLDNLAIKTAIEYNNIDALSFLTKINPIDFTIDQQTIINATKNNSFDTLYFIKEHIKLIKNIGVTGLLFICIENNNLELFKFFLNVDKKICIEQQIQYASKYNANKIFFYIFNNFEIVYNDRLAIILLINSFSKNNIILFKFLLNEFSFFLLFNSNIIIKNINTENEDLMLILLENENTIIQDKETHILKGCLIHKNNSVLKLLMKKNISLVFNNNQLFIDAFYLNRFDICKLLLKDKIVGKTILYSIENRKDLKNDEKLKLKTFVNINLF